MYCFRVMFCFSVMVFAALQTVSGFINNNRSEYIIDVTPSCPLEADTDAIFTLLADVPAYAQATCRGDHVYEFVPVGDGITFLLAVSFEDNLAAQKCVFHKKQGSDVYVVLLEVGWGEPEGFILTHKEQYQVSCAYGRKTSAVMMAKPVDDWLLAPKEQQFLMGDTSQSNYELRVINVMGDPFFSSLPFGRWIQLEALSDGSTGEKGLRAISCTAKSDVASYAILRAGCGDGLVIDKKSGFQTRGLRVFSPYFEAFRLMGEERLSFICNFTLCEDNCDGNSCSVERKRSADAKFTKILQIVGEFPELTIARQPEKGFGADRVIRPLRLAPINLDDVTEAPDHSLTYNLTTSPSVITWVLVVLVIAVTLLVLSSIIQICITLKKSEQRQPEVADINAETEKTHL